MDLALAWDIPTGSADLLLAHGDLVLDGGLRTAVIVSLMTDRLAAPDDAILDGSGDRRGYWGDALPGDDGAPSFPLGSRLWLLARALQVLATLNRARAYALESLAWMLEDGVVGQIVVTPSFPALGWLQLDIELIQAGSSDAFTVKWQAT